MGLRIIGKDPMARDERGELVSRIATIFPNSGVLVTERGIHATQRSLYIEALCRDRAAAGLPALSHDEQLVEWDSSVDLIIDDEGVLIRPDPSRMELAFCADECLQTLLPKQRIRFLYLWNEQVRRAIKRRGECWRISALPRSPGDMNRLIAEAHSRIDVEDIFYYSRTTGTHFVTYQQFGRLGGFDEPTRRRQLHELQSLCGRTNQQGNRELGFFGAGTGFREEDFAGHDFLQLDSRRLDELYAALKEKFFQAAAADFREDDPGNLDWRNRMVAALLGRDEHFVPEEVMLGLGSEFFMQLEWLPGGRIEDGELIFDSVLDENQAGPPDPERQRLCDPKCRGFIFNFIREYGDLEYVNIGRIASSLSQRRVGPGRRAVYVAELKPLGGDREIVRIIRIQKYGVREHLDAGKSLLDAMLESEQYTQYILDRRLGCRQLGMNLAPRSTSRRLGERYFGRRAEMNGIYIWTPYFERDYIAGRATDKIPSHKLKQDAYAMGLMRLLGAAAAPNLIVGRCDLDEHVIFDDGDEVVLEHDGLPTEIVVTDHTGTFVEFRQDLAHLAVDYAQPINCRLPFLTCPEECAAAYVDAFVARFAHIQEEYLKRQRAFDTLFQHQQRDPGGSFAYRWEKVLERLAASNPRELGNLIRQSIKVR